MPEFSCAPFTIPFVLSLLVDTANGQVAAMFGWGFYSYNKYKKLTIPLPKLTAWVAACVESGIFEPGEDDLYIWDGEERLKVHIYHEAGINITTTHKALIERFVERWLSKGFPIIRQDGDPPTSLTWHTVQSVADAVAFPATAE